MTTPVYGWAVKGPDGTLVTIRAKRGSALEYVKQRGHIAHGFSVVRVKIEEVEDDAS